MTEMHSYGVDNQSFRLRILGWIALFAFVVSLQRESLIGLFLTNVPASLHLPKDVSPISFFTIIFTLSFVIYDRLLWTLNPFDKIPNLSGTWVGMATNPYFEPLRLELMQIDQTWTKVSISLEIYEENHFDRGDCLGTEHSRNARITECERKYCDFDFQYLHDSRSKKDSFGGSFFLKYTYRKQEKKKEIYELTGEYSTTKSGKDRFGKDFNGVAGRIAFRRVSLRILELKEILRESEYHFFEIKKEMTSQIREFSKN